MGIFYKATSKFKVYRLGPWFFIGRKYVNRFNGSIMWKNVSDYAGPTSMDGCEYRHSSVDAAVARAYEIDREAMINIPNDCLVPLVRPKPTPAPPSPPVPPKTRMIRENGRQPEPRYTSKDKKWCEALGWWYYPDGTRWEDE